MRPMRTVECYQTLFLSQDEVVRQASETLLESVKSELNIDQAHELPSGVAIHNFCGSASLAASAFAGYVERKKRESELEGTVAKPA